MKHIIASLLLLFSATISASQSIQWQRPVTCYTVDVFTATMKEFKMKMSFAYDTPYGVMGGADNGTIFIIYVYEKKENKVCIYAESEAT